MNTYHCSEIEKIIKHTWRRIRSLLQLLFAEWSEITLFDAPSRNSLNGSCKTSDLTLFLGWSKILTILNISSDLLHVFQDPIVYI